MKTTDIRKAIKGSTVEVSVSRAELYSCLTASIRIAIPSNWESGPTDSFAWFTAQANDLITGADPLIKPPGPFSTEIYLEGVGPWYAVKAATVHYAFSGSAGCIGTEDPERIGPLIDLIRKVSKDHNLAYRYPECEVSRMIEALRILGATFRGCDKVEKIDRIEWNDRRRALRDSNSEKGA